MPRGWKRRTCFAGSRPAEVPHHPALRQSGHVVGYLGDGINDAPSLHTADVGFSVDCAVDVAKEAAAMILLQQDLGVLDGASAKAAGPSPISSNLS